MYNRSMENLQLAVREALDNAIDNGYDLASMTTEEIAEDLIRYDAALEDKTPEELIPHIQSWWSTV